MNIHLIAIGTRMPAWVVSGYEEYARRMPPECRLRLVEIPPGRRGKSQSIESIKAGEGRRLLAAIPPRAGVIALDVAGQPWSTMALAARLRDWRQEGRDIALLVGGPDGLAAESLERAEQHWSLSALTLPHALVRILVAEQLYRAWTLLSGHPYHRS